MFDAELVVGKKYQICTGTIGYMMTFKGLACQGTWGDRILVFENEDAKKGQRSFVGATIELHYPYHTEKKNQIKGQLYAKYYGPSIDKLTRHGLPEEPWAIV